MAGKKKRNRNNYSSKQKVEAVLSVWTEQSTQTQLCKSMGISSVTLMKWQEIAMAAMLEALEGGESKPQAKSLSPRLENLLSRQVSRKLQQCRKQEPRENG